MWQGFDWGKYSKEIRNEQLTLRLSVYGIEDETEILNEV